jgi:hypothetical protein
LVCFKKRSYVLVSRCALPGTKVRQLWRVQRWEQEIEYCLARASVAALALIGAEGTKAQGSLGIPALLQISDLKQHRCGG